MPSHAIIDRDELAAKPYRGMNPAFVRQVWAKRKREHVAAAEPEPVKSSPEFHHRREQLRRMAQQARHDKLVQQMAAGGIKGIMADVAMAHGVTLSDILGTTRYRPAVAARHAAICEVARQRPAMSLSQLGKFFNRDHTSILHVLHKFQVPGRSAIDRGADR